MAAAQVVTTRLALHVPQLHRQDMRLLTLAAVDAQVAITLQGMPAWHPQITRVMLSFLVAEAAPVATIHQARVVWPTNSTQVKRAQEAVRAERAR